MLYIVTREPTRGIFRWQVWAGGGLWSLVNARTVDPQTTFEIDAWLLELRCSRVDTRNEL